MSLRAIRWLVESDAPAGHEDISSIERQIGLVLPDIYKEFLQLTNGAMGNLVSLYGTKTLVEMNLTYEVQQYAPGYVSIGNDHGGYHLLMKADEGSVEYRLVSDGVGVPSPRDSRGDLPALLQSADGNPWPPERT